MGNVIAPLWADCPAATRLLCAVPPAASLALMLVQATSLGWLVDAAFTCSIRSVFTKLHLWTLLVGPLYEPISSGMAFLMVLLTVYMAMLYLPSREKEVGTAPFLLWMLWMNLLTNLVYLLFMFALATAYRGTLWSSLYMQASFQGLWPLIVVCLTLQCLANPTGSTSFWGLVQLPNKWYPVCLAAFFCALNGLQIQWDLVAALVVGYLHAYLRLDRVLPSQATVARLEQRCCGGGRTFLGGTWVPATSSGYQADAGDSRYANLGDLGRPEQQRAGLSLASGSGWSGGGFKAFSGAGNRLGDGGDIEQAHRVQQQEREMFAPASVGALQGAS